ncbi:unnamed protein product [Fraxinus pennsylvanica]|uniref:EG45-like domain containing protein n=1 Tax=Fraxinus pennsylvanica TaxID=56036 RepID=A0AAD2AB39_9LAMI|nr:unnamed protein product [Fraxinus pennsylvanica]
MAIIVLCKQISLVHGDIGTATSHDPPYTPTKCHGNRQDQFPPGNLFVAVNEGLWDNGASCGRRYRLRCLSGNNRPCKEGFNMHQHVQSSAIYCEHQLHNRKISNLYNKDVEYSNCIALQ